MTEAVVLAYFLLNFCIMMWWFIDMEAVVLATTDKWVLLGSAVFLLVLGIPMILTRKL
jgi:inner membrane protein involved in colicin E2 resistance